ncbi:MAG: arsenite methyltransferase [Verrucomicrobiota bacterium JB022]|nr:arsenite methyltransferase [Verrucomicrobiota bacterium JB022]
MSNEMLEQDATRTVVRERYRKIAETAGESCCAPSCCGGENKAFSRAEDIGYSKDDLCCVPEGSEMGLGCGNPTALAQLQPGETVLDLGCGGGFDCFLAARAVGSTGRVIGVDMTPEMISKARRNAREGGYSNVEFRLGEIEALPVPDGIVDAILSNCVINLSPDKPSVFREAHRVLKAGGRLSLADIVATKPIPPDIQRDFEALTSCVAGAAQVDEVDSMLKAAGFSEVRIQLKEETRAMINQWSQSGTAGEYVVSALIEARK